MKTFGIVVYPEDNNSYQYQGRKAEHGKFCSQTSATDISGNIGYPIAVFFDTPEGRDAEMEWMLKNHPNVMFCKVEVTAGKKTQPNPKATEFSISKKGILPV